MKHVMLKYTYVQDVVEKTLTKSCIHQHEAEQSRSDDKVSHIRSTQERLRDDRIETPLETEQRSEDATREEVNQQ